MARPLRITFPGAFYHVTSRGNERKAVFITRNAFRLEYCRRKILDAQAEHHMPMRYGLYHLLAKPLIELQRFVDTEAHILLYCRGRVTSLVFQWTSLEKASSHHFI